MQLAVLDLVQAIPNQFYNLLQILYHFDNLPWVWRVAIQEGCHSHQQYHHNLGPRNHWKCQIQMCFELEELNLKVVMMGLKTKGGDSCWDGGKLWGWGCHESSLDKRGM